MQYTCEEIVKALGYCFINLKQDFNRVNEQGYVIGLFNRVNQYHWLKVYFPTSQAEKKNKALGKAYLGKVDRVQSLEKKEV